VFKKLATLFLALFRIRALNESGDAPFLVLEKPALTKPEFCLCLTHRHSADERLVNFRALG
jgi:hypothetical protein